MKIVGTIGTDNLLVAMTPRELARVSGLGSYEDALTPKERTYGRRLTGLEPGTEYEVGAAWDRLRNQAEAAAKLGGVSKTLSALADLVTQTKVAYTNATAAEPQKEGGAA